MCDPEGCATVLGVLGGGYPKVDPKVAGSSSENHMTHLDMVIHITSTNDIITIR